MANKYKTELSNYQKAYNELKAKDTTNMSAGEKTNLKVDTAQAQKKVQTTQSMWDKYQQVANDTKAAKIQQTYAKDNALKYMQNQMNAVGLQGQGVAGSTKLGVMNNYAGTVQQQNAALAETNKNLATEYQTQMASIDSETETKKSELDAKNAETYSALLANEYDLTKMKQIYEEAYNSISDDLTKEALRQQYEQQYNEVLDLEIDSEVKTLVGKQKGDKAEPIARQILIDTANGELAEGTVINFNYGKGTEKNRVLKDGKWVVATSEDITKFRDYLKGIYGFSNFSYPINIQHYQQNKNTFKKSTNE